MPYKHVYYNPEESRYYANKIESLFEMTKKHLTNDDIEIINDLIIHGECGVAFEILIDQLSQYSPPITHELYNIIAKICHFLKTRESSLEHFEKLITKNPHNT